MFLIVKNLSPQTQEKDVKEHFSKFLPEIRNIQILDLPNSSKIAEVTFESKATAYEAVQDLAGSILRDTQIFLELKEYTKEPKIIKINDMDTSNERRLSDNTIQCKGCNEKFACDTRFQDHVKMCDYAIDRQRILQNENIILMERQAELKQKMAKKRKTKGLDYGEKKELKKEGDKVECGLPEDQYLTMNDREQPNISVGETSSTFLQEPILPPGINSWVTESQVTSSLPFVRQPQGIPAHEQLLNGISPQKLHQLKGLAPQQLQGLSPQLLQLIIPQLRQKKAQEEQEILQQNAQERQMLMTQQYLQQKALEQLLQKKFQEEQQMLMTQQLLQGLSSHAAQMQILASQLHQRVPPPLQQHQLTPPLLTQHGLLPNPLYNHGLALNLQQLLSPQLNQVLSPQPHQLLACQMLEQKNQNLHLNSQPRQLHSNLQEVLPTRPSHSLSYQRQAEHDTIFPNRATIEETHLGGIFNKTLSSSNCSQEVNPMDDFQLHNLSKGAEFKRKVYQEMQENHKIVKRQGLMANSGDYNDNLDREHQLEEEQKLRYFKEKALKEKEEQIRIKSLLSGKKTVTTANGEGQDDVELQQMQILEEIKQRNLAKAKEEEATRKMISQLMSQNAETELSLRQPQIRVEHYDDANDNYGQFDEFELVVNRKKVGYPVRVRGFDEFDFPILTFKDLPVERQKIPSDKDKRKLAMEEEAKERRRKEQEFIQKARKEQERSRKVTLVSTDDLLPTIDNEVNERPKVPESITDILLTTKDRKARQEIKKSVKHLTNLEEKFMKLKIDQAAGIALKKERLEMANELKKRRMMEESSLDWIKEGDIVFLNDKKGTKRHNSMSDATDDLLLQGRAAAMENRQRRLSWKEVPTQQRANSKQRSKKKM